MDKVKEILGWSFGANTVQDYALAFAIFLALFICFKIIKLLLLKRLRALAKKTSTEIDDLLIEVIGKISNMFYLVVSLYFPLKILVLGETFDKVVDGIFIVVVVYQAIQVAQVFLEYGLSRYMTKHDKSAKQAEHTFAGLRLIIRIVLWSIGILLVLSNLGFNISTLIASLGVGGIAVALAMQNILADMFSSFSIYFDKPFEVGDNIIVGEHQGTVKEIGLKTTRLKALKGEELVISNQELTSARIQNFKKIDQRRVVFTIGVTYETDMEKLKKVNGIVKNAIESQEMTEFDRSHFIEFGEFSLNFEIVYFVNSKEHPDYVRTQEQINLQILEEFNKEGIEMAYPSQKVFYERLAVED